MKTAHFFCSERINVSTLSLSYVGTPVTPLALKNVSWHVHVPCFTFGAVSPSGASSEIWDRGSSLEAATWRQFCTPPNIEIVFQFLFYHISRTFVKVELLSIIEIGSSSRHTPFHLSLANCSSLFLSVPYYSWLESLLSRRVSDFLINPCTFPRFAKRLAFLLEMQEWGFVACQKKSRAQRENFGRKDWTSVHIEHQSSRS